MTQPPRHDLVALDALRGVAAFAVVLGHMRSQILLGQHDAVQGSGWQRIVLVPTGFASEAVALFFVISGYLVGGQVIRNVRSQKFTWKSYAIRRLSRLYIVVIPAIAFTFIVDLVVRRTMTLGPTTLRADHAPPIKDFACNIAFLQNSHCEAFGSNGSLWSLSYEFWFYVSFAAACVIVAAAASRLRLKAVLNLGILVGIVALFGWQLVWLAPVWLLGTLLAVWQDRRSVTSALMPWWKPVASVAALLGTATALTILDVNDNVSAWPGLKIRDTVGFIIVGLVATPVVHFATQPCVLWSQGWVKRLAFVGTWSFTMYAFHRPIVMVVSTAFAQSTNLSPLAEVVAIYITAVLTAIACYPLYFIAEVHTDRLRRWLFSATERKSATVI